MPARIQTYLSERPYRQWVDITRRLAARTSHADDIARSSPQNGFGKMGAARISSAEDEN